MPNGHAMNPTLLFDTLLAQSWNKAKSSANAALSLAAPIFGNVPARSTAEFNLPKWAPGTDDMDRQLLAALADHDAGVNAALLRLQQDWAQEFQRMMSVVAPTSEATAAALAWYGRVMAGGDGIGYVGRDHRVQQSQGAALALRSELNPFQLPMPERSAQAITLDVQRRTGVSGERMLAEMDAHKVNAQRQMAVEALGQVLALREQALDAAMDYVFSQINLMFDVFGRNNDYLTQLRRNTTVLKGQMQRHAQALAEFRVRTDGEAESREDASRVATLVNDRYAERVGMLVDSYIKRIRRHSSRAAAALNGIGVSVTSSASESNTVDLNG